MTCHAFFTVTSTVARERFRSCVQPYVKNVDRFSDLLRTHGAVISGSAALRFFLHDEPWAPGDLDVYVSDREYESFLAAAIWDEALAFRFEPRAPPRSSTHPTPAHPDDLPPPESDDEVGEPSIHHAMRGMKEVRRFRTKTGLLVDVIRSPVDSPVYPIQSFWGTLVTNFITPDGGACGFPHGTLRRKGYAKAGLISDGDYAALTKYAARGFLLEEDEWWADLEDPSTWDDDYFGDTTAAVLSFRRHLHDPDPPFPIFHTKRGWRLSRPFPLMTVRRRRLKSSSVPRTDGLLLRQTNGPRAVSNLHQTD